MKKDDKNKEKLDKEKRKKRTKQINQSSYDYAPKPETLEQAKKKQRRKNIRRAVAVSVLIVAVVVCFSAVCFQVFFQLEHFEVTGSTRYTAEEIMRGAGLSYGMNLYEKSRKQMQEEMVYHLPFVEKVRITRVWPSTIRMEVTEAKEVMYVTVGNEFYTLSEDLRVLAKTSDIAYIEQNQMLHIEVGNVTKCMAGEMLAVDEEIGQIVREIYRSLAEENIVTFASELDVRNKFDIRFVYKSRFTVKLGDSYDTDLKIRFMKSIEEKLYNSDSGTIDVSDEDLREGILTRNSF